VLMTLQCAAGVDRSPGQSCHGVAVRLRIFGPAGLVLADPRLPVIPESCESP